MSETITTAEKYRNLEESPLIQVARYIFEKNLQNYSTVLLGDILEEIKTGKTPSKHDKRFYQDEYISWFKPNEIGGDKYLFNAKEKLSQYAVENNQATIYKPETILINAIGDVGRVSILKIQASSNQQITGIKPDTSKVSSEYLYYYLVANRHLFYKDLFKVTLPIVNQKKISQFKIKLSSLKVQNEITSFLSELEKIDDIKQISDINFDSNLKKLAKMFYTVELNNSLLIKENDIQQTYLTKLRQAILQEAIEGKLTAEWRIKNPVCLGDPNTDAAALLTTIKTEKQKLIAEGKIKKEKPLAPINPNDMPFTLPNGWVWVRLGEIIELISGQHIEAHDCNNIKKGFPYLTGPSDFGKIYPDVTKWTEKPKVFAQINDLLITVKGSGVGKVNICNLNQVVIGRQLMAIRSSFLNRELIKNFIFSKKDFLQNLKDGLIPGISRNHILDSIFPLPPLAEQQAIVERVDRLLNHINALEQQVTERKHHAEQLMQAVLKEAFTG